MKHKIRDKKSSDVFKMWRESCGKKRKKRRHRVFTVKFAADVIMAVCCSHSRGKLVDIS